MPNRLLGGKIEVPKVWWIVWLSQYFTLTHTIILSHSHFVHHPYSFSSLFLIISLSLFLSYLSLTTVHHLYFFTLSFSLTLSPYLSFQCLQSIKRLHSKLRWTTLTVSSNRRNLISFSWERKIKHSSKNSLNKEKREIDVFKYFHQKLKWIQN